MKKLALSAFVLCTFAWFALVKHGSGVVAETLLTPPPSPIPPTDTPAPTVLPSAEVPTGTLVSTPTSAPRSGAFRDGAYTGDSVDVYYGYIKVQAKVQGGRLTDISILDYPRDRGHSVMINNHALPILKSEAVSAQSANVDAVSGATATSTGFQKSLASALSKAK